MRGLAPTCKHGAHRQVYLRTLVLKWPVEPLGKHDIYSTADMLIFYDEFRYITINNTYRLTYNQKMHVRHQHSRNMSRVIQ